jgi:hypothetical protein
MTISVNIPEEIVRRLENQGQDLPRLALEGLAVEAYRAELLTFGELQRLLGFDTPYALDGFLKVHGAYLDYTPEELEREAESGRRLGDIRQRELKDQQRRVG